MTPQSSLQTYINHIALVIDESGSMVDLRDQVVKVVDNEIKRMAVRSKQLDQQTRVSVYTFNTAIRCIIFDTDVLRLPSIADYYRPDGQTALLGAISKSIDDLTTTSTIYGDHSFLIYVFTDGQENYSHNLDRHIARTLPDKIRVLADRWTLAMFVPDQRGKAEAMKFGIPKDNIAIWDATATGLDEVGETVAEATDSFFAMRAAGVTGTKKLFSMDAATLNHKTVGQLKELTGFRVEHVKQPAVIKEFIDSLRPKVPFVQGANYFPLIKRERINDSKEIVIRHKVSGKIYGGPQARTLVGLPDTGEVSVAPQPNLEYDVFVQSTSLNRKLIPGHDLLIKV